LRFALGPASNDQGSAKIEDRLGADMLDAIDLRHEVLAALRKEAPSMVT
jgi:hypothetical protein